jgi:hypothetical protein
MGTGKHHFSQWVFLVAALLLCALVQAAGQLKVMRQGQGAGTVVATSGATINCGAVCDENITGTPVVTLHATIVGSSFFVGWGGDCALVLPTSDCVITMDRDRSIRADFRRDPEISPLPMNPTLVDIQNFLSHPARYNTPGDFMRALDPSYKQGWILMTRSESLQTGTAQFPRIILPSRDTRSVFTVGLAVHGSYPGADPHAIEFMQWDPVDKTFRFHEIVLEDIAEVRQTVPVTPEVPSGDVQIFPARPRGLYPN